jgi:hypothetical protein
VTHLDLLFDVGQQIGGFIVLNLEVGIARDTKGIHRHHF